MLITGAAGSLGRAVAAHFAARGDTLALLDRDGDALAALARELPGSVLPLATDLLDPAAVLAAVEAATGRRFGGIDALCNLAGGFAMGDAGARNRAPLPGSFMLDLNVNTMLHSAAAVVPGDAAGTAAATSSTSVPRRR